MIVLREGQREGLALARLHATHGILKFLEHLAFADQKLEVLGLAALEGLAIDLAFEVHRHAVTIFGGGRLGALGERAALLTQDVQGLFDGSFVHFSGQALDLSVRQVGNLHFGKHLEHGVKGHLAFGRAFLLGDARLASHAQLGLVGRLRKSLAHLVVQHFVLHRVAVALGHHAQGHLAGTEAIHLHGTGQALEAGVDFGLDGGQGQAQRDLALKLLKGFNSNGHLCS